MKKLLFSAVIAELVFILPLCLASSPEQLSIPQISKIIIEVDGQADGEDVEGMISIKEGEAFSLKKVSEDIKHIFRTGLFSDIQVLRSGEKDVELIFLLTKRLFTRKIKFLGDPSISKGKLRESLYVLREDSPFSEKKLATAVEELRNFLEKEGYFQAEVKADLTRDIQSSSVDVSFEVSPGERYLIRGIDFIGDILLPEESLKKKMKSQEGQEYIPLLIEDDVFRLERVYHLMGHQRAEIETAEPRFNEEEKSVYLTFKINPHEKIKISIRGATVPLNLITPIWQERIFEEWGLAEGEAKILGYLRKDGYIFASVKSSIERSPNEMHIIYGASPGIKYKIKDVTFKGITYFTPDELKNELEIGAKVPLLSGIDGERLFELSKEIELVYKTHGFPQTIVDLNFRRQEKNVIAVYYVDEGIQEKINNIHVEGVSQFNRQDIMDQISSFEGGPFFGPNIQKDIEKLDNFYLNRGIRGTEISVNTERIQDSLVSLTFNIREGTKVRIEKIIITGNLVTRRSTILRELRIKEGDFAYYEAIVETKRRLERLGIFSEIRMEEVLLGQESENVVIRLREGKRNYVGLGIGLETRSEPYTFQVWNSLIRPRGTAEYIRGNILGTASQLSFVAQVSLKENRGVISWEQPYIFGLPWRSSLNAWIERDQRKSFDYDRKGISLTAIKSPLKNVVFFTTLRWVRTTLFNLKIAESGIDRQHHPFSASSISGSFVWDKRDDPFNPEIGSFLSFVAEWAYPVFNAESDFLKNFFKYQQFFPILSRFGLSSTARFGIGTGKMPIHERFFAGGSNSFRGVGFDELGPTDPISNKPVGGKALLLLNFELKFPFFGGLKDLYGAVFYDKGNVFPEIKDIALNSLQDALGIGIRYRTPLGPVRFDVGWNLDAPEGKKKVLTYITIGHVF